MAEKRTVVKLDKSVGRHGEGAVAELQPGPRPYLWIGDNEAGGRCFGTISGAKLRKLRDALNEAIPNA